MSGIDRIRTRRAGASSLGTTISTGTGDVSEFNILLGKDGPVIIDFPQVWGALSAPAATGAAQRVGADGAKESSKPAQKTP